MARRKTSNENDVLYVIFFDRSNQTDTLKAVQVVFQDFCQEMPAPTLISIKIEESSKVTKK